MIARVVVGTHLFWNSD